MKRSLAQSTPIDISQAWLNAAEPGICLRIDGLEIQVNVAFGLKALFLSHVWLAADGLLNIFNPTKVKRV